MNKQNGQVLLIIIMLLATVTTVMLAVSFKSVSDTKVSKLEADSQKTLSAAEAGIEAALQTQNSVNINSLGSNFAGFTGSANISQTQGPQFVTPLLQQDQEYTFYLSNFSVTQNQFGSAWNGTQFNLNFDSEGTCVAVEVNLIDTNNNLTRQLVDPCPIINNPGATGKTSYTQPGDTFTGQYAGDVFQYKATIKTQSPQYRVAIIRVLGGMTKLGFFASTAFNLQGNTVTSEAQSQATGIDKKIQLFQSYPQIPSDFFVTNF